MAQEEKRPSVNYPFREWCRAKGFTPEYGYKLISRGELAIFKPACTPGPNSAHSSGGCLLA